MLISALIDIKLLLRYILSFSIIKITPPLYMK
nr:MAG TPA: hypothetical protein [Caudoviricetes sp.]DAN01832.1 MAG TPA: hypothetical protein [Bacteriophage sp.]